MQLSTVYILECHMNHGTLSRKVAAAADKNLYQALLHQTIMLAAVVIEWLGLRKNTL
jgi:hypothetical protein